MTELLNTLYVQTQGASLHLDNDAVRLITPDTPERRVLPLRRLDSIVVLGHVSISTELLTRCAIDGRAIIWMSRAGRYLARIDGPTRGNVLLRHTQHGLHDNTAKRLDIARACVAGKIQNSRQVVLRGARDAHPSRRDQLRGIAADLASSLTATRDCTNLDNLLGVEGRAARTYFTAFSILLRPNTDLGPFTRRVKHPATDPTNALMSFLYGLLRGITHGAVEHVGLDPYIGFLHGLRPGKPALALDLMEELRPVLADRLALTLLNRRQLGRDHFETLTGGAVQLTDRGRSLVLTEWHHSRQRDQTHRLLGRRVPVSLLPAIQARLLARHIRGELPTYLPWTVT